MIKGNSTNQGIKLAILSFMFASFLSPLIAYAQSQENITTSQKSIEFLSIQHAQSGSLSENNATSFQLKLDDISNQTILFSDRPERIVESISLSDFVGKWTTGPNSFESDPPNAVLVYENMQTRNLETNIIELFNPVYDMNMNILTYGISTVNTTSIDIPSNFGQSILVIDAMQDSRTGSSALCAGCGGRQCPPC